MFTNLFSNNPSVSETGVYEIKNGTIIPINIVPENGSINAFIKSIGYGISQVHIIHTFEDKKISSIGVKIFTMQPVIVFTEEKSGKINLADVNKAIKNIDWEFEYSPLNIESILDSGIETLSLDFLKSVLNFKSSGENLYLCTDLDLYLQFNKEGYLEHFVSSELENVSTKYIKGLNKGLFESYYYQAKIYHNNELDIYEEVNNHSDAILNIPNAINNEFVELHRNDNNLINFYNLYITHYNQSVTKQDFLFMNKGRYKQIDSNLYLVGKFIYKFNYENSLIEVVQV